MSSSTFSFGILSLSNSFTSDSLKKYLITLSASLCLKATSKYGSIPLDAPDIILMVPVGAIVVLAAFLTFCSSGS